MNSPLPREYGLDSETTSSSTTSMLLATWQIAVISVGATVLVMGILATLMYVGGRRQELARKEAEVSCPCCTFRLRD
jgi:hypothetical protein